MRDKYRDLPGLVRRLVDDYLSAAKENDALKRRLEIDDGRIVDGIDARNETIKLQDERVDELKAERDGLRKELERLRSENEDLSEGLTTAYMCGFGKGKEVAKEELAELKAERDRLHNGLIQVSVWLECDTDAVARDYCINANHIYESTAQAQEIILTALEREESKS